ncbi:MAG: hypothetical protein JW940_08300, partial [Polyangiaceae bacterium]|nr:hypothetical protein [Polyangiaceae bacterium]
MKVARTPLRLAMLLAVLAAAAMGQWLESTVFIPDSFGGLRRPNCLVYDSADNRVFVAGALTRTILVIDGTDGHRVGRIPFEADVRALCYNPLDNKVYAAACDHDTVAVLDASTMQVVASVATGDFPAALAYSPTT